MNGSKTPPNDTRNIFMKEGTCSHTFFHVLNRDFGHPKRIEERASDPLASTMQTGNQCGMLWGSSLAIGAESFRRYRDPGRATGMAIAATRRMMESFERRAGSVNCRDIIGHDLSKKSGMLAFMAKFFLLHDRTCFTLAEEWTPEAIRSAREGLSQKPDGLPRGAASCASEVVKILGGSDEQSVMVAGFAGGLGLSGNACGALCAAVWFRTMDWCREHPGKMSYANPHRKRIVTIFLSHTGSELRCSALCGRNFATIAEHTDYINTGGCGKLIDVLGKA